MLHIFPAAVRTSYLSVVLPQGEGLFERLMAVIANVIVHGHETPPDWIQENSSPTENFQSCDYFFSENWTDACVSSQLSFMVHVLPPWSKLIVKFSTGPDVFDTDMGIRASSSDSYL